MIIGVPKEIMADEYRVALTPDAAKCVIQDGHRILMEGGAGLGAGFVDGDYSDVGCSIVSDTASVFNDSELILKVKQPLPEEYDYFHEGQIIFSFLHLAANEALAGFLCERKITGIAYESVTSPEGGFPILRPMSEIAGRLSVQEGAKYLETPFGGRGVLLGAVSGSPAAKVLILGGGTVGTNACHVASGMGAEVSILDRSQARLKELDTIFEGKVITLDANDRNLESSLASADLVIGAVLIPNKRTPRLIQKSHLKSMKRGSLIVDVSVDQGGCCETTRPTTHHDPVYTVDGVQHWAVANMPAAVPVTATTALIHASLPYILEIANSDIDSLIQRNTAIRDGLTTHRGELMR